MPLLTVQTSADAEIFVMDGSLTLVKHAVGFLKQSFEPGLYKVKVNRGGAIREQVVALQDQDAQIHMHLGEFPAVAPIGPMLGGHGPDVEQIAREALNLLPRGQSEANAALLLCHWKAGGADPAQPFKGVRLFPWGRAGEAVDLGHQAYPCRTIGDLDWAAAAVALPADSMTHILEIRHNGRVSRQSLLAHARWASRVFIRRRAAPAPNDQPGQAGECIDVSIQMAMPSSPVVYIDHYQTIETARNALEKSRPIFASRELIYELLGGKYDNPVAGMVGLHLYLDALERRDAVPGGDPKAVWANVEEVTPKGDTRRFVREVFENLLGVLSIGAGDELPPDLMALQARAGLARRGQLRVKAPPMFWESWNALKAHSGPQGWVSIGRDLWQSVGDGACWGPYLAWSPARHGLERRIEDVRQRDRASEVDRAPRQRAARLAGVELAEALGIPFSVARTLRVATRKGRKGAGRASSG